MTKKAEKRTVEGALGRAPFYPTLEKRPLENVLNEQFLLEDAHYIENWHSDFGEHPLVLLKGNFDGKEFTTISSGQVVVSKVRELIDKKLFPVYATIVKVDGGAYNRYYDII